MSGFPFQAPIHEQLSALADNMELLQGFADKYPDLMPWAVSTLVPSVMFGSDQVRECRDAFGSEGWQLTQHTASKTVDNVLIECRIPVPKAQEVTL